MSNKNHLDRWFKFSGRGDIGLDNQQSKSIKNRKNKTPSGDKDSLARHNVPAARS